MSGRSTIFTGTPPRPATWTGPRSPIRSDAIQERTSFGSRYPNRAVRLPTGSSTRSGTVPSEPLSLESISLFFRYALSLTAWKRFHETTWSLRANPSSGNLHPTEGYAVLPAIEWLGDAPAVYHYAPKEHALERRAILDAKAWSELCAPFPEGSFLVGLSSVHWREAWKYGERAFRYCQHDAGHALATLRIAAAALGWGLVLLDGISDSAIAGLFGLSRGDDYGTAEREEPELLALVTPGLPSTSPRLLNGLTAGSIGAQWCGRANTLSPEHRVEWPVIDEVAQATRRSGSAPITEDFSGFPTEEELFGIPVRQGLLTAEKAILGRRSAVAMDGSTAISQETFFRMLARLMPTRDGRSMPWDAIPWRPRIHLGLFVHRVEGVPPGLYALARDPDKLAALKEVMRREFRWQRLPSCPPGLPLYLLQEGDCRRARGHRLLRPGHRRRRSFQPGNDRGLHGQPDHVRCPVLPEPVLGGRHGGPGALPRGRRGGYSLDGDRLLLR